MIIITGSFLILLFFEELYVLYEKSILLFIITIITIAVITFSICKKEYNRIKNTDIDRIKKYLMNHITNNHRIDSKNIFLLVDEEKSVTKNELLKRCFCTYETNVSMFVSHGEFLCEMKVSPKDVRIQTVKRISTIDFQEELQKK
ncbi:hypothetical protein [Bacillus sp. NPDC094106]|uniref:hypothetical protein n=1 Tax=Bacillus sp. NPDC094106 TaxID=3363949 RepID=UPI0037F1DECD